MNLLPSARDPFSWHAVPGGTPRHSPLADELLERWFERLEADGILVGRHFRWPGATWVPVVDLSLSEARDHHYFDEDGDYLPGRSILAVADHESTSVLPRWTPVTFARGWDDLGEDEMGTNYWAVSEDAAGVAQPVWPVPNWRSPASPSPGRM
ncbi:MAG: hypothetical protein MUQ32_14340 [Chloroflexi bacterium]|nr:hypothetical protein [Chloroflexota bacterium]